MKHWLLLSLAFGVSLLCVRAQQVEFRTLFVASPLPIRTAAVKFSAQPGLVTTLTAAAQKDLVEDLGKSTPAPQFITLSSVTGESGQKVVTHTEPTSLGSKALENDAPISNAQLEAEAHASADSRVSIVLRVQAHTLLGPSAGESEATLPPVSGSAPSAIILPPVHTDILRLQALVNTTLPSGEWALIYLGKSDAGYYFYALASATVVKP